MNNPEQAPKFEFFMNSPRAAQDEFYPLMMELYRWADTTDQTVVSGIPLGALSNCNPKNEDETFRDAIIRVTDLMTKHKTYYQRLHKRTLRTDYFQGEGR